MTETANEKKLIIRIPEELHTELKILAVKRKTTMQQIVCEIIEKELQAENVSD